MSIEFFVFLSALIWIFIILSSVWRNEILTSLFIILLLNWGLVFLLERFVAQHTVKTHDYETNIHHVTIDGPEDTEETIKRYEYYSLPDGQMQKLPVHCPESKSVRVRIYNTRGKFIDFNTEYKVTLQNKVVQ